MVSNNVPTFDELMTPTIGLLKSLRGSGTNDEVVEKIIETEKYSDTGLLPEGTALKNWCAEEI